MHRRTDQLKEQLTMLFQDVIRTHGPDYVLFAIKKINDQQLTHVSFRNVRLLNEPILKLLNLIVSDIEVMLFDPDIGVQTHDELKDIIVWSVEQLRSSKRPSGSSFVDPIP